MKAIQSSRKKTHTKTSAHELLAVAGQLQKIAEKMIAEQDLVHEMHDWDRASLSDFAAFAHKENA